MKSVVDDDELRVRITMKWMSQHSHKIPPLDQGDKSEFAGFSQVHLFHKFCGYVIKESIKRIILVISRNRFHHTKNSFMNI